MSTERLNEILANASERVAFVGDYHGNLHAAELQHIRLANQGINLTFQAGDFGFVWGKSQYERDNLAYLDKKLGLAGITMLVVLGNHENYDMIEENLGDEPWFVGNNVVILPRAYMVEVHGKKILGLGGAPSIDRKMRREGVSWWPQEEITDDIVDKAIALGEADIVVSHDAGNPFRSDRIASICNTTLPYEFLDATM